MTTKRAIFFILIFVLSCSQNSYGFSEKDKDKKEKPRREKKLKEFKPSVDENTKITDYSFHQKIYHLQAPIELVWKKYSSMVPNQTWKGPLAKYKQSYSKENNIFHYRSKGENNPNLQLESIYFLKLKIFRFLKIGVTFQVTKIDSTNNFIELTYGQDNASHGRQRIYFFEDDNNTIILHISNFKSDNKFRDNYLYPKFHEKYIDEFHQNIKQNLILN